eukprot:TRINITY_DN19279_c0_g1_i1.p1 TRINITY_DN19279_c0_g1~~TRINITY_DN19279_c0_g1_i1.p1  ORF type:complete len:545 (+),score=75.03 TRINITY_DN19279_c0_g1_i1:112-1746(+)
MRRCLRVLCKAVTTPGTDNEITKSIERLCGIDIKMTGVGVHGRLYKNSYDTIIHEISPTGRESKLKYCPSYNDVCRTAVRKPEWKKLLQRAEEKGSELVVHFNLYLDGIGTQTAIKRMSRDLGIEPSKFNVASLKESNSCSTQRASVVSCSQHHLSLMNDMHVLTKDLRVGDFQVASSRLGVGEFSGNRFDVVIRNVTTETCDSLASKIRNVIQHGFVNYVGYQRFNPGCVSQAYDVAVKMLQKDWRGAAFALLTCRPTSLEVATYFEENDFESCLKAIPPEWTKQITLLEQLIAHGDPRKAVLTALPKIAKVHCLSSLQAVIWNKMASRRISLGHEVQMGDLVMQHHQVGSDNEDVIRIEEESQLKQFSLRDVVLPMPGIFREDDGRPVTCLYPKLKGVTKDDYEAVVGTDYELPFTIFEEASGQTAIFHGQFRRVWENCNTLQCYAVPAMSQEDDTPVIITDNMHVNREHFTLRMTPIASTNGIVSHFKSSFLINADEQDFPDGKHLILSFGLPTTAYPAMLLREICVDVAYQMSPSVDNPL